MNILDEYKSEKVGLSDLVSYYSGGGDVRELVDFAKTEPERISALYVLCEIYKAADPVWKEVVQYASDPEYHTSYGVLKLVHERAREDSNFAEIVQAISSVNIDDDRFFAKVVAILNSVRKTGLGKMLKYSIADGNLGYHATGLSMLVHPDQISEKELRDIYILGNNVVNVYICSLISKYFRGKEIEDILPPMVKEDLAILRKTQDRIASGAPVRRGRNYR